MATSSLAPPDAAEAAVSSDNVSITNHVIRIPHVQYPTFLTQVTHLQSLGAGSSRAGSSLLVWCGPISSTVAASLIDTPSSSSAELGESLDDELDKHEQEALIAAGRASPSGPSTQRTQLGPLGALASEFSLAMSSQRSGSTATSSAPTSATATSLFASPSDVAQPMSRRIASKLNLPQLFLSLDIPHPILPSPATPQAQHDSLALLALERAIRDVCQDVLSHSTT
ncbi:hypothetical protein BCV70DRAFT_200820 [Testicularia cyperi]|uniref:Uncharacterized protein n=1 Tax=Testicularia cyperi TaxID=1882483 RepID=A0A317XRD1_9BASI|nr:hypothetical protein BCV70DRAFT_200820 [Testicularia cyperi]